ncbi:putative bifunctional diguanylate cyclase/phosphodiesterase [Parasphingorhabdus pacifica]
MGDNGPDPKRADDGPRAAVPPTVAESGRHEFVRLWTREVSRTSYVPMARQDVEAFLTERFDELVGSLFAEEFSGSAAARVGTEMVRAHFTGTAALQRTLFLLATELPPLLPVPIGDVSGRLMAAIGELAAGFAGQLREQTLDQQEVIKQAVLQARDAAEEALRASEARLRAVFTSSALGIAIVNLDGLIEEVNAAMSQIFTTEGFDLVGNAVFDLVDPEWLDDLRLSVNGLATGDMERFQAETRFSDADGTHTWAQLSASLVRDGSGEPDYQVFVYEDITERHMLQEQFRRQATRDPLTGLANRTLLKTRMDTALEPTHPGRRVGLCYFDLDGFKAINDSLGHPIGDQLLRSVAQRLNTVTAAEESLATRMGGDEFVVLVPDSKGISELVAMVERMLEEITAPVHIAGHELNALASVGVVEREVAATTPDELLRDADVTLYRAKADGRAQWVLFDPEHNAATRERFKLSAAMPAALQQNEMFVEYEPIVWLEDMRIVGVDARVRWDHDELGELDQERFLGLAEETGLITRLGSWVLERVCEHAVRWQERFGSASPRVGLGITRRHFHDPELVGDLRRVLTTTGLPVDSLVLGVPEDALFDREGLVVDTVEVCHDIGLRVGVRDFGREYGRVARLRGLPVSAVKITGEYLESFDDPAGPPPLDEHLVASFVRSAHLLGFPVVASGVDTDLQAKRLGDLGVHGVQGQYTGGTASAMEIESMIAEEVRSR